jgi:predicted Zn-dependent peptidase
VGDFNSKEMKAALTVLFSKWEKSSKEEESLHQKTIVTLKEQVLLVNKEDAKETTFISVRQAEIIRIMLPLKW